VLGGLDDASFELVRAVALIDIREFLLHHGARKQ
jgi:hypothetical protein